MTRSKRARCELRALERSLGRLRRGLRLLGLRGFLNLELDAAVLRSAERVRVGGDRSVERKPATRQSAPLYAFFGQIFDDRARSPLRQVLVVRTATAIVGMTADLQ